MENRILLTGGSGYLGSVILSHLRDKGEDVFAPPTHEMNVVLPDQVSRACFGETFKAMILAHGVYGSLGKIKSIPPAVWGVAMEVNFLGVVRLVQIAKVSGPIVVMGGAAGGRVPFPDRADYAASKAALNSFILTAAAEGVPIYGVAPGPHLSQMNRRFLQSTAVSATSKKEMEDALKGSVAVSRVLAVVDSLLRGEGEPGHFYSAR